MNDNTMTAAASTPTDELVDAATSSNLDVLMRRSSPLIRSSGPGMAIEESMADMMNHRGGSNPRSSATRSSPLRLSRPRSNPRNRTPMRYESPLNADAFRNIDEEPTTANRTRMEGQRITIRPLAGMAVGTTVATGRVSWGGKACVCVAVLCFKGSENCSLSDCVESESLNFSFFLLLPFAEYCSTPLISYFFLLYYCIDSRRAASYTQES